MHLRRLGNLRDRFMALCRGLAISMCTVLLREKFAVADCKFLIMQAHVGATGKAQELLEKKMYTSKGISRTNLLAAIYHKVKKDAP